MGCAQGGGTGDMQSMAMADQKQLKNASKKIANEMNKSHKGQRVQKKLLLLGTGSSGKSTLFKSLKKCNDLQEDTVLVESRHVIRQNIVAGILTLLKKSQELFEEDSDENGVCQVNMDDEIVGYIQTIVNHGSESFQERLDYSLISKLGEAVYNVWNLEAVKATFSRRGGKYSFPDNMDYFFEKSVAIMKEDYFPSQADMVRARVRTTGIVKMEYEEEKGHKFIIFDVGGQRNERKKWIHQFESVAAVLFVTALNHYNAVLFEDEKKNAMHEAVALFTEICKSKWFNKSEMILFLNKDDLFKEKLKAEIPLDVCFSENAGWEKSPWEGPNYHPTGDEETDNKQFAEAHDTATKFITEVFMACSQESKNGGSRVIFTHITCATDEGTVGKVFMDVQNMVIRSNLRRGGLMI